MDTATALYEIRSDGIIVQRVKPGAKQELKDAQDNMNLFLRLADNQKACLLVDLRESGPTGAGVREFYSQQSVHLLALGMVIGSPLSVDFGSWACLSAEVASFG
jgi:hypothetical protein